MNKKCFLLAFKTSIPVLFGYLAIGIAFGLLVVENDYPWWIVTVMSIIRSLNYSLHVCTFKQNMSDSIPCLTSLVTTTLPCFYEFGFLDSTY